MKVPPPPDLATLMDFVRFHAVSGDGRLDEGDLIAADSSNTFMESQLCVAGNKNSKNGRICGRSSHRLVVGSF